ncbi:MAG: hypothetical protein U0271_18375 [Polyangiaceae bacterium]
MADPLSFKEIFANYFIDDGNTPAAPVVAAPQGQGGTGQNPIAIPNWKISTDTIKKAERQPYKAPAAKPALTDIELSQDEHKRRNWLPQNADGDEVAAKEGLVEGPTNLALVRGFRLPYVRRLDKNNATDKKIIDGVKAVRSHLPVPKPPPGNGNHGWLWTEWQPPSGTKKVCAGYGWSYYPNDGTDYAKWMCTQVLESLEKALGTALGNPSLTAAKCMVLEGGSPSAINTYDGNVLTMGIGHGLGAHKPWKEARDSSAESEERIRKAFELCGISIEYEKLGTAWIATYQIVDLSDDDNPMVVYCDNYHHGYGWILRDNKWLTVRPRYSVESLDELSDGTDDGKAALKKEFTVAGKPAYNFQFPARVENMNSGGNGFAGYKILKYLTNKKSKTDLEVLYAYIAIAEDPLMREALLNANWTSKVRGSAQPANCACKTEMGAIFVGTISHECGLSLSKVTAPMLLSQEDYTILSGLQTSIKDSDPRGGTVRENNGILTYAMMQSPASPDEARAIHDALLCKAVARACACMWENDRIAEAIRRFNEKTKDNEKKKDTSKVQIDLTLDNIFNYAKQWRMETLRTRWKEMTTGKILLATLSTLASGTGQPLPAALQSYSQKAVKVPWMRFEDSQSKATLDLKASWGDQSELVGIGSNTYRSNDLYGFPIGKSASALRFLIGRKSEIKQLPQVVKDLSWNFTLVGVEMSGKVPSKLTFSSPSETDPKVYSVDAGVLARFQFQAGT